MISSVWSLSAVELFALICFVDLQILNAHTVFKVWYLGLWSLASLLQIWLCLNKWIIFYGSCVHWAQQRTYHPLLLDLFKSWYAFRTIWALTIKIVLTFMLIVVITSRTCNRLRVRRHLRCLMLHKTKFWWKLIGMRWWTVVWQNFIKLIIPSCPFEHLISSVMIFNVSHTVGDLLDHHFMRLFGNKAFFPQVDRLGHIISLLFNFKLWLSSPPLFIIFIFLGLSFFCNYFILFFLLVLNI